jgi:imidazolonepropionase
MLCERDAAGAGGEGLVDAVDAFCERIGFSHAQTARVFEARGGSACR